MIMFNNRVINKKDNNNMYATTSNNITREHKRNVNILNGILLIVDIANIKYHMNKLNKYHKHVSFGMFSKLSIVKQYKLKNIQLCVLYNNLYYNGFIK